MSARRPASAGRSWLLGLAAVAACNAIVGIEDPEIVGAGRDERCILNSDCDDPMHVCLFETCSPPCERDVDCDDGEFCLSTLTGNGCVSTGKAGCAQREPCPEGSACFDGECRTDCRTDAARCLSDQVCEPDGACRGPGGGGGAGGSNGTGGSAGTATGGGGPGGEGGDGGGGGSVTPGDPCSDEGAVKCAGQASPGRLVCENAVWVTGTPCGNGELCDTTSDPTGRCAVVPDECRGRTPGEAFCEGATRTVCGADLVTTVSTECDSVQHCALATGPDCAACLPNEHRCTGDVLEVCDDERSAFDVVEECLDEPCNADAGACTTLACVTVGERRCMGDRLEACNSDRSGFDLVDTCEPGLCDPVSLECDACVRGERTCADDGTQRECDDDGQDHTDTDCPASTPICTGAGQCVGCTRAEDCTPPSSCYTRACNTGTGQCQFDRFATHQPCSGGYCTAAGECVECTRAEQCSASGACYDAVCSGANECGETPKATTVTCAGGYCNGSGACVRCNDATQCPNPGECYNATCSGSPSACGQTPKGARTSCNGGLCNGSGACVACLMNGDCTQPSNECQQATCTGNQTCMTGPKNAGVGCSGGSNTWVCNGSGACVDCVTAAQCTANEVCHSNACVLAEHLVGNASVDTETRTAFAGSVTVCRLPPLQYAATLVSFGVAGNASGLTARTVLYADSGGVPSGMPIATNAGQNFPLQGGTLVEVAPSSANVTLNAGTTYWVGVTTSAETAIRGATNTSSACRVWAQNYTAAFGAAQMGNPNNGFDFNLVIRVRDTQ
ncbi:MAG TPA: hypothetical protein VFZ53_07470 [Polyangiaceae bacterium]